MTIALRTFYVFEQCEFPLAKQQKNAQVSLKLGFKPLQCNLKLGIHEYFDQQIEVLPVRTIIRGLCYKLKFRFSS